MNVKICDNGLLIVPETEFEKQYIRNNYSNSKDCIVFIKRGETTSEIIGLKISPAFK